MVRRLLLSLLLLSSATGCSHLVESRAIAEFQTGLKDADLERVKATTSTDFESRALRNAYAIDDLKVLRIPDGKTSVVNVEEVNPKKRRVTVEVGDKKDLKKEVFYDLVMDDAGKWVVDDVYLKQRKQGVTAIKSVTEQMDLLLSVREFLDAWEKGERDDVLKVCAPTLRGSLADLPPAQLAEAVETVTSGRGRHGKHKPLATMDEKTSLVRLPRNTGELVLTFERTDSGWQTSDVAIDTPEESQQLPSLFKRNLAVASCLQFLAAYSEGDRPRLSALVDERLYNGCISIGDLASVPLPPADLSQHSMELTMRGSRADFVFTNDAEMVQINMNRIDPEEIDGEIEFRVKDVTLYDSTTSEERRISALFTAQGMLELFTTALRERDLDHLRHASTREFATRVWDQLDTQTLKRMPLEPFDRGEAEILRTKFQGSLTVVEVRQGGQVMNYHLREQSGRFYVDDVVYDYGGMHSTLRTLCEYVLPVRLFASGLNFGQDPEQQEAAMEVLRQHSSYDMNRLVWSQTDFVPHVDVSLDELLRAPVKTVRTGSNGVVVVLADDRPDGAFEAEISLVKERNRYLVEEVHLLADGSSDADSRVSLKDFYRVQLANGSAKKPSAIRLASHEMVDDEATMSSNEPPVDGDEVELVERWNDEPVDIGPIR